MRAVCHADARWHCHRQYSTALSCHADAGDHVAVAGERDATTHGGVATPGYREERIKRLARLYEWKEVGRAHPNER